jgi:hypothetical protein
MAESSKVVAADTDEPIFGRELGIPNGWKYKPLKVGPIRLPWYASPESQLLLVSFVCFLCPGKIPRRKDETLLGAEDMQACSTPSMA